MSGDGRGVGWGVIGGGCTEIDPVKCSHEGGNGCVTQYHLPVYTAGLAP